MPPLSYSVGGLRIEPNVVLAPMEGVTDLTFRRLIRTIGDCGLTHTEFVASKGLGLPGHGKLWEMARIDPDERPVAVQLFGNEPDVLAEAARRIQDELAPSIIDLNMGCPSKKVCAHSGGSSLLKAPTLAQEIVRAMRQAIRGPFTVKMRSGFDPTSRNAPDIAWMCQEEGVDGITIHWRTRADLYGGQRAVDKIAEAKSRVRIPVLGNGDITDVPSALRMFADTGCDGIMVGRGAIQNPWLIKQIAMTLRGEAPQEVDLSERRRVMLGYLDDIVAKFRTEHGALGRFKKIANHMTRGVPGGEERLRTPLLRAQSVAEARDIAERFFASA